MGAAIERVEALDQPAHLQQRVLPTELDVNVQPPLDVEDGEAVVAGCEEQIRVVGD